MTVGVGHCGNWITQDFWSTIAPEHNLDKQGRCTHFDESRLDKIEVYFSESQSKTQFRPRTVFVDIEPSTMDVIRASGAGQMFVSDSYCCLDEPFSTNGLWPKGHFEGYALFGEEIQCALRRELERCEAFQG